MATVGADVTGSWFLSLGLVGAFVVLLLLSVFLSGLCSNCGRRSFALQQPELDRDPPSLIRVVKLEEAVGGRENPSFSQIRTDEENTVSIIPWRSHLGAPQNSQELQTNGAIKRTATEPDPVAEEQQDNAVVFTSWRSHLGVPQSQDLNHSNHIYQAIGGERSSFSSNVDALSPTANQEQVEEPSDVSEAAEDIKSMYARVSKRTKTSSLGLSQTPEQVKEEEEAEPPLPDRSFELDEDKDGTG